MIKIQFKKEINASAQKVYESMLGLKEKSSYEHWTAAFNPTSSYEGSWERAAKFILLDVTKTEKKEEWFLKS